MTENKDTEDFDWRISPKATSWFKTKLSAESAGKVTSSPVRKEPGAVVTRVNTRAEYPSQDPGFFVSLIYLLWFIVPLGWRIWAMKNDPELQDNRNGKR